MLPGLPWLIALAALALDELVPRRRALVLAALLATQVMGWFGPSWHDNGGHHLDCNLRYRTLLRAQQEAVRAVAAERPRAVVASFPFYFAFADLPDEGWLPAPVAVVLAAAGSSSEQLCGADFFVESDQSAPIDDVAARLASALTPWRTFGIPGLAIRVSRIHCAGRAASLAAVEEPGEPGDADELAEGRLPDHGRGAELGGGGRARRCCAAAARGPRRGFRRR